MANKSFLSSWRSWAKLSREGEIEETENDENKERERDARILSLSRSRICFFLSSSEGEKERDRERERSTDIQQEIQSILYICSEEENYTVNQSPTILTFFSLWLRPSRRISKLKQDKQKRYVYGHFDIFFLFSFQRVNQSWEDRNTRKVKPFIQIQVNSIS